MRRWPLPLPAALLVIQGCATASVGGGRFVASGGPDLMGYQVARESPLIGALGYETSAHFRTGGGNRPGWMAGLGADISVLAGRADNPYLIGGVEVGIGTRSHPSTWSSWSLGLGQQMFALGPVGVRAEARFRRMSAESREGVEVTVRIGRAWRGGDEVRRSGGRSSATPIAASMPSLTVESAGGGTAGALRIQVTGIAAEAMGTPYRWGGTDANGFDCSGLIQYAYRQVGVDLPRRSVDQALAGREVPRELDRLLPGDILVFATARDGEVNHVGLYLGERRFLHSATGGVQVSLLSDSDPYGRWWWQRWHGVRRVVQDD